MGKGSGGTKQSKPQSQPSGETFKYTEAQSTKMIANIHTSNIWDVEDKYTNQEKVASILKVNEQLATAGFEGYKVRSLSIEEGGSLGIGSIGILLQKGAIPAMNRYAIVTPVWEPAKHYWKVSYDSVSFQTATLDNIKEQANTVLANKFSKKKDDKYENIHGLNAHVANSSKEQQRISIFYSILHQQLRKK